jgi:hypothetical protein
MSSPNQWTVEQVWDYIGSNLRKKEVDEDKLKQIQQTFIDNDVTGEHLSGLNDDTLKRELGVTSFGMRRNILNIIRDLTNRTAPPASSRQEIDRVSSPSLLEKLFDCDQTPEIRDTQRIVAICTYFVKRFLYSYLKRLPSDGQGGSFELIGVKVDQEKRGTVKVHGVKLDMTSLQLFDQTIMSKCTQVLPDFFKSKGGSTVPLNEVLGKAELVLKFNSQYFSVDYIAETKRCKVTVHPAPLGDATGDLDDSYERWNPVQQAFWEANRCQTARVFCAGGKTLVQIIDALGLTPHPFGRYDKTLICGNSRASVNTVRKYFQTTGARGRGAAEWRDFDETNYDSCNLSRFVNLQHVQYRHLMDNRVVILEDSGKKQARGRLGKSAIVIASAQRVTSQRRGSAHLDDCFGHIIIDEGDYGFAGPDVGSGRGEWKKMRDGNKAAFITYYSGTTQNAQGCEIPAPYISISYKDLALARQVKTLCFVTLFGPMYRNVLPDGKLWNPREVPALRSAEAREEADACRRKILGPGLYVSVCRADPPRCVLHAYIRRALEIWISNRNRSQIPTQLLVFAPKIGRNSEPQAATPGQARRLSKRQVSAAAAAAAAAAAPTETIKVETKELVRKLVPVFESILRELGEKGRGITVGCAIGSEAEGEEAVERFRRYELDILINIKVLERSADFPMIDTVLDLHSHSTPETGKAGAYAAAIQRFTRAARIMSASDPAIRCHPRFADFGPRLEAMREQGTSQKMVVFELDLDPREWILNRFCSEEDSLLTFGDAPKESQPIQLLVLRTSDQKMQQGIVDYDDEEGESAVQLEVEAPNEEGADAVEVDGEDGQSR